MNVSAEVFLLWFWGGVGTLFLAASVSSLVLFKKNETTIAIALFWLFFSLAAGSFLASWSFSGIMPTSPDLLRMLGRVGFATAAIQSLVVVSVLAVDYFGVEWNLRRDWKATKNMIDYTRRGEDDEERTGSN